MPDLEELKRKAAEIEKRMDQLRRYRDGSLLDEAFGPAETGEEPASPGPEIPPAQT